MEIGRKSRRSNAIALFARSERKNRRKPTTTVSTRRTRIIVYKRQSMTRCSVCVVYDATVYRAAGNRTGYRVTECPIVVYAYIISTSGSREKCCLRDPCRRRDGRTTVITRTCCGVAYVCSRLTWRVRMSSFVGATKTEGGKRKPYNI